MSSGIRRGRVAFCLLTLVCCAAAQSPSPILNRNRPLLDAHNCYPYEGKWSNRIDRALGVGAPIAIEQDLALAKGDVVVSHTVKTTGGEPTLRQHFFERVRPMIEAALKENDRAKWPLITVHFDFKDNQPALLHAVWQLLGEYKDWITTAEKTANRMELAPFDVKPLLVLTEDSDAQEQVFFGEVPVGERLCLFGSAHTTPPQGSSNRVEFAHLLATVPPSELLRVKPTNYRRWWNNPWNEVEEGGQQAAGDWNAGDENRLRLLVDYAHGQGFWIRFYTLDGFRPEENEGWGASHNFGSLAAVKLRWKAALDAGVDLIATDQYEELAAFMKANHFR